MTLQLSILQPFAPQTTFVLPSVEPMLCHTSSTHLYERRFLRRRRHFKHSFHLFRETKRKKSKLSPNLTQNGRFYWKKINIISRRHNFRCFPTRCIVVTSRGLRGRSSLVTIVVHFGGSAPPNNSVLTLLFKVSPFSVKSSRSLVFKDRDLNCLLFLSFQAFCPST